MTYYPKWGSYQWQIGLEPKIARCIWFDCPHCGRWTSGRWANSIITVRKHKCTHDTHASHWCAPRPFMLLPDKQGVVLREHRRRQNDYVATKEPSDA